MDILKSGNPVDRKKIVVMSPFPVYPPIHGGQQRIFHLYRYFAKWFDIEVLSISYGIRKVCKLKIAPGMWEIRVPRSNEHKVYEDNLNKEIGAYVGDIALIDLYKYSDRYIDALKNSSENAEVVIVSHLFLYPAVKRTDVKRVWYDSHNVEYLLRKQTLGDKPKCNKLLDRLKEIEKECCNHSELILTCSQGDALKFNELYGVEIEKTVVVPNGVPIELTGFFMPDKRIELKREYRATDELVAVFLGSGHIPNIIAANSIINLAERLPNIHFTIIGPVGNYCNKADKTPNVQITGTLDDNEKNRILSYADVALNPIPYGSGTNLKMLEYFAFGIPVISTAVGIRGLSVENGKQVMICETAEFEQKLKEFEEYSLSERSELVMNARMYVEQEFDWGIIANSTMEYLDSNGILKRPDMGVISDELIRKKNDYLSYSSNAQLILEDVYPRPIMIWGAGNGGRMLLRNLMKLGIKIYGFIDSDAGKEGTCIENLKIYQPDFLIEKIGKEKPFIIIASMYSEEIRAKLMVLGYVDGQDYIEQDIDNSFLCLVSKSE